MKLTKIKETQILKLFEKETGICKDRILEHFDAFPFAYTGTIQTEDKTFNYKLTYNGRAKKGTFEEEK